MEIRRQQFVSEPHDQERQEQEIGNPVAKDPIGRPDIGQEARPKHWKQPEASTFENFDGEWLARGLGWLGIGLGLAEIMAPRSFARFLGTRNHAVLFRLMGLREITTGIGILTCRRPAGWLWTRVAGDIIDLVALGKMMKSEPRKPVHIAIATAAVGGVTALDVCCARELSDRLQDRDQKFKVKKTILINRSPEELYRHWRDFQNLPRFMKNLESVEATTDIRSHWVAKGPAGKKVEWDAEIIEERPSEFIKWRSLDGADVEHSGSVRFDPAPGGRGTLVSVELQYSPTAGVVGATVAKIFGRAPEQEIEEDLRRFKQVMETGEIITTQGQPAGRSSSTSWKYDQTIRRASASR